MLGFKTLKTASLMDLQYMPTTVWKEKKQFEEQHWGIMEEQRKKRMVAMRGALRDVGGKEERGDAVSKSWETLIYEMDEVV